MPTPQEIEALVALAEQKLEAKEEQSPISEVHRFIIDLDIKPGDTRITPIHVYDTYVDWSSRPMSMTWFGREFKRYFFQSKRVVKGTTFYMLDPSSFDMSEEAAAERKNVQRERLMGLHAKHKLKNKETR